MGGCVGVDAFALCFEPRADHCLRGAFAVGARDVDHRRQAAFWIAERIQQTPHPIKRQVNDLGVQRHHAREDDVRILGHVGFQRVNDKRRIAPNTTS